MAKIYCIIQTKLNQLVEKMSIWSLTYQQSVFKRYYSDKHFSEFFLNFLPTIGRQKPTGIDMEQNYVTVTNCIAISHALLTSDIAHGQPANCYNSFKYKNMEV